MAYDYSAQQQQQRQRGNPGNVDTGSENTGNRFNEAKIDFLQQFLQQQQQPKQQLGGSSSVSSSHR